MVANPGKRDSSLIQGVGDPVDLLNMTFHISGLTTNVIFPPSGRAGHLLFFVPWVHLRRIYSSPLPDERPELHATRPSVDQHVFNIVGSQAVSTGILRKAACMADNLGRDRRYGCPACSSGIILRVL